MSRKPGWRQVRAMRRAVVPWWQATEPRLKSTREVVVRGRTVLQPAERIGRSGRQRQMRVEVPAAEIRDLIRMNCRLIPLAWAWAYLGCSREQIRKAVKAQRIRVVVLVVSGKISYEMVAPSELEVFQHGCPRLRHKKM